MKKIFVFITILTWGYFAQAQESRVFYYYKGEKIYLDKIENTKVIHFSKAIKAEQKENIFSRLREFNNTVAEITPIIYSVSGNSGKFEDNNIISDETKNGNILYSSNLLIYKDSTFQWSSNKIIVTIQPNSDLRNLLYEHKVPFLDFRQLGANKQTYLVELAVAEKSAIDYANMLTEKGKVVRAQPDFWKMLSQHNAYYDSQWNLQNTEQYGGVPGNDINVANAWAVATGAGVKVAVIDCGVDLTHPDLIDNLLPGYDATDADYGGSNGGYKNISDSHGSLCSGIIVAADNDIGIKGIAYEAKVIPIRYSYYGTGWGAFTNRELIILNEDWTIDAINKAWKDYGADILSCSWNWGSPSQDMEQEIDSAVTYGRNSLGCLVVFSSGNDNTDVSYPACLPNVMAVGAMSPCGERKSPTSCDSETTWGSNYCDMLDLVAPGVLIPSTDIQGRRAGCNPQKPLHTDAGGRKIHDDFDDYDYTVWFNGTSAACPHVAGVAALVLSVNPNLTQAEVRQIISSTCTKINEYSSHNSRGYVYSNSHNHPYGRWNNQVGYGAVNAYEAVYATLRAITTIEGPDMVCSSSVYSLSNNNIKVDSWSVMPNTFVIEDSDSISVTIKTSNVTEMTGTLTAIVGGDSIHKTIHSCITNIAGYDTVCFSGRYILQNGIATSWNVTPNVFVIENSDSTSVTITTSNVTGMTGTLTAVVGGDSICKIIHSCVVNISGYDTVCLSSRYTLDNGIATSWSIMPNAFTIVNSDSISATVLSSSITSITGTLTAVVNGNSITKTIHSCPLQLSISGNENPYLLQDVSYTLNGLPTSATVVWSGSNNVTIFSGQGTNQVSVYICRGGGTTATITATVTIQGNTVYVIKTVGINNEFTALHKSIGYVFTFIYRFPYAQCYDWVIPSNLISNIGTDTVTCIPNDSITCVLVSGNSFTVNVREKKGTCISPWAGFGYLYLPFKSDTTRVMFQSLTMGSYLTWTKTENSFSANLVLQSPVAGATYRWCFDNGAINPDFGAPLCWETNQPYMSSDISLCGNHDFTVTVITANDIDNITIPFYVECVDEMMSFVQTAQVTDFDLPIAESLPNTELSENSETSKIDEIENPDINFKLKDQYSELTATPFIASSWSVAYPNPTNTELIIDKIGGSYMEMQNIEKSNAKATKVLLYSHSTTKLVYSKDYPSSIKQIKIDTSKFPNGVYYLNIIENGEKVKEQTIIIQH